MSRSPQHRPLRGILQQRFTQISQFDANAEQTYEGQAFFAATGPSGAECGGCSLFMRDRGGGRCAQFVRLTGKQGKTFPSYAPACKYYQTRAA
jgi:hypothetical protein